MSNSAGAGSSLILRHPDQARKDFPSERPQAGCRGPSDLLTVLLLQLPPEQKPGTMAP